MRIVRFRLHPSIAVNVLVVATYLDVSRSDTNLTRFLYSIVVVHFDRIGYLTETFREYCVPLFKSYAKYSGVVISVHLLM